MSPNEQPLPSTVVDLALLGRLFEENRPKLVAMVQRRIDPALAAKIGAEDVVNEAFLATGRKWAGFEGRAAASTYAWLYRIVRGCLIDAWRRATRDCRDARQGMPWPEQSSLQVGLGLVSPGTSPSAALSREELCQRVRQVMALLRDRDRDILWMRHADDLSYEEIAAVLGITENAAHQRYHRALGRLSDTWLQLFPETGSAP
jgi:RNA polymerase sigma-70 factor (ECF subfamily)